MTEAALIRTPTGFLPATPQDEEKLKRWKLGDIATFKFTKPRNSKFHNKFFAMLNLAFDSWEVDESQGEKNFDRFRKDITILAGYRHAVVNIKGEVRYEADSISFGSMDDIEFEKLYSAVANVILKRILKNYSRDDLDNVVEQMMSFV